MIPLKKLAQEIVPKNKGGDWLYSNLYLQLDAIKDWHGPLPSQMGLCDPELDLILITQHKITSSQLETTRHYLDQRMK